MRTSRRRLLAASGLTAGLTLVPAGLTRHKADARPPFRDDPFSLGVASGDPRPDSVVLWTRLAPDPLAEDGHGGMPNHRFPVQWEVARDDRFRHVVRRGLEPARPESGHSVHAEVRGLDASREYFYRFRAGREISPTGRTRTAPEPGAHLERLAFAFASCQNYPDGFYPAYQDMARQDLAVVFFLGDYIYEGTAQGDLGRGHLPAKDIKTLAEYRVRFAQYKTDPDLRAAHAAFPWIVALDDHDVDNNWAGDLDGHDIAEGFLLRRAAAFQAFYEHQPMRQASMPHGPDMQLYRRFRYGDMADFSVTDTRQFRSNQPQCADDERIDGYCPDALDPGQTILGERQKRWLLHGLSRSHARWNVVAHQTRFAPFDLDEGPGRKWGRSNDTWGDGYVAERTELLDLFQRGQVRNPVVLGGDAHRNWVFDLKRDFDDPASATLATEFMGTSISSGGDHESIETRFGGTGDNPHEVFVNAQRGYVRCELTPDLWRSDFRVAETVREREAAFSTRASLVVEDGRPGAQRA